MTRDVLPGTRDKSFKDQCAILNGFKTYQVPTLLEASVCILMEYVTSGTRLFSDSPWTYTRCQEKDNSYQVTVGGFSRRRPRCPHRPRLTMRTTASLRCGSSDISFWTICHWQTLAH